MLEPTSKKPKSDKVEDFKYNWLFDKENKIINGAIVVIGDLVFIKCYIRY